MATEVLMNKLLFQALVAEDKRTCLELLEVGADPTRLTTDEGIAPVHLAVGLQDDNMAREITEAMLHMGADPNVRCVDGATPVHIAAMQGRCDTLDLLLLHGGDPALLDPDGQTGYDCARSSGCDECMRIMRQHRQLSKTHTMLQTPEGVDKVGLLSPRMDEIKRKYKTRYSVMLEEQLAHMDSRIHQLDVTSPDHPVLVYKQQADVTLPDLHGINDEPSPRHVPRQLFNSLDRQSSDDCSLDLHSTIDTRARPTPLTSTFDTPPSKSIPTSSGEEPNVDEGIGYYPDTREPQTVTKRSLDEQAIGYYPDPSDGEEILPVIKVLDPSGIPASNHQEMTRLWVSQYARPDFAEKNSELDSVINKGMVVEESELNDFSLRSTLTEDSHVKLNRNISESNSTGSFRTAHAENSPRSEISVQRDTPESQDSPAKGKAMPQLHKSNFDVETAKLEVEEKIVRSKMCKVINDMCGFVGNFGNTKENCQEERTHRNYIPKSDFDPAKPLSQTTRQQKRYEQSRTPTPKREPLRTLPRQIYSKTPVQNKVKSPSTTKPVCVYKAENLTKPNKTPQKFQSPKVGSISSKKTEEKKASRTPQYQRPKVESVSSSMDESLPRSHSPKPYAMDTKQTLQQQHKQDRQHPHYHEQQQQQQQEQQQQQQQQQQHHDQQKEDGQQAKEPPKGILKTPISNLTYDIVSSSNHTCTSSDFARDLDFGAQSLDLSELSREISKLDTAESSDESWVLRQIEQMEKELEREIKQETEKRKDEQNQMKTESESDSEQPKAISTKRFQDILRRLAEGETLERIERKVEIEPALYRRLSTIFEEKSGDFSDYNRRQSRGKPNESELRKLGELEREWLDNQQGGDYSIPDLLKDSGHLEGRTDQEQELIEQEREIRLRQERKVRCQELLEQERQKRTEKDLNRSVSMDSSFFDDSSSLEEFVGDRQGVRYGSTPKSPTPNSYPAQNTPKTSLRQTSLNESLASVQSAKSQASVKSQSSVASSVTSQGSVRSQQSVKSQGSVASSVKSQASVKSKGSTCSCQSAVSVQTVYKDPEDGTSLIEIHYPPDAELHDPDCTIMSAVESDAEIFPKSTDQADICIQVSINISDESASTITEQIKVPPEISCMMDGELRQALVKLGDCPGPVVPSTRRLYEERLVKARQDPGLVTHAQQQQDFPVELTNALSGQLDISSLSCLELSMSKPFVDPDPTRKYREGTLKASFIYLLLDPTITANLPVRIKAIGAEGGFKTFVRAIFYVGKGKRSRPYMHFREAIKTLNSNQTNPASDKVRRILSIWAGGQGVISLHVFQNVIPEEAFTREACIIDAIGLSRLTNQKGGEYYGPAHTWFARKKRQLGVVLLRKAFRIFLSEGERQIKPHDVKQ